MYELFFWLVQCSARWKPTQSHRSSLIVPRFQWGVMPSQIGFRREYANYENGLYNGICKTMLLHTELEERIQILCHSHIQEYGGHWGIWMLFCL